MYISFFRLGYFLYYKVVIIGIMNKSQDWYKYNDITLY